jgi:2-dehydro-3-deoxygalactonokinase
MKQFLSCDWGTSSLRLRLVNADGLGVIDAASSNEGIAATFALWQASGKPEEDRAAFYLDILKPHIAGMEDRWGASLSGIPVIISGMASSTIGLIEIPYTSLPVNVLDAGVNTAFISQNDLFDHDTIIISGIRTNDDVIRGEETQLIGCVDLKGNLIEDELFLFPGTHSKHIHVKHNEIIDIKTYMTGEFFELLSQKSILKNSVEAGIDPNSTDHWNSFKMGITDAVDNNLLNAAFRVRTNNLFGKLSKSENHSYLSGLLIATELKELANIGAKNITMVCNDQLSALYHYALQALNIPGTIAIFDNNRAGEAIIRGQFKIYNQIS